MPNRGTLVRTGLMMASVTLVGLAACDGGNRFTGIGDGPGDRQGAPRVEVAEVRASVPIGDSLRVSARARDAQGIVSVSFVGRTVRGDPNLGTDETVIRFQEKVVDLDPSVGDTTLIRFLQPADDDTREQTFIVVTATDSEGNTSQDSVPVTVGGPGVTFLNLSDPNAGTDLPIQVEASDPQGISTIRVEASGLLDTTIVAEFSPAVENALLDTLLAIPAGATGTLELSAEAVNTRGVSGFAQPVALEVTEGGGADAVAPSLSLETSTEDRLEVLDRVRVTLTGSDDPGGSGIVTAGVTILAVAPSRGDTVLRDTVVEFDRPRSGTVNRTFSFQPFNVDSLAIPDTLNFEVTGFFIDDAGNCGATTGSEDDALPCAEVTIGGVTGIVAENVTGQVLEREIVAGRTVLLPAGGTVMDAVVDTLRRNLLLSNIDQNRLELFRFDEGSFGSAINVGSAPFGLALVNDFSAPDPDSLIVANSGGVNMEVIDLDQEAFATRFNFPDVLVFEVTVEQGDAGFTIDVNAIPDLDQLVFSDRPQFVAVDTFRNRIFSTMTEPDLGEVGTVRKTFFEPGWEQSETKLFVEHAVFEASEDQFALAHVDAVGAGGGILTLTDHPPGFPSQAFTVQVDLNQGETVGDLVQKARDAGSDVFFANGLWNIPSLGFNDTTFVTASGDGTLVAIGEGAEPELGRVLLHEAGEGETSNLTGSVRVADLLTNRPGPVRGLGLNYDGTLGIVRGDEEVAAFDDNLQLQGSVELPGGAGSTLHPLHANSPTLNNPGGVRASDTHLAFVGSSDGTIDIVDTNTFLRVGSIRLKGVVTGPLKAALPFASDNAAFQCGSVPVVDRRGITIGQAVQLYEGGDFRAIVPNEVTDERCVVVKLFAVTDEGGVVVVDVRKADVLRFHPLRGN